MRLRHTVSGCVGICTFSLAAVAGATPGFPDAVQQFTGSAAPPPCTICHTTAAGGANTANTPFALYLKSRGLVPYNVASLKTALQAAKSEMHDSNNDGTTDITALQMGLDPNAGGDGHPAPQFGCGARIAPSPPRARCLPSVLVGLFVGLASLLRKARRRRVAASRTRGQFTA